MTERFPGRVLLVDDEEVIRELVSTHLTEQGWTCQTASDGKTALELARKGEFDVVLTDVRMPGLDGLALSRELHLTLPSLPVIVVTAVASFDSAVRALKHGAFDYIVKPFQLETLDTAVTRAIEHHRRVGKSPVTTTTAEDSAVRRNEEQTKRLIRKTRRLRASNDRLRGSFEEMARVWVDTLEARRLEPRHHCRRVRAYAVLTARQLGLSTAELHDVSLGCLLHHVGLLRLPENLVHDADVLSPEHRAMLDEHPQLGQRMLADVQLLAGAGEVIAAHHERFDGGGPLGLAAEDIPVGARCFAVADAADEVLQRHPVVTAAALDSVERELSLIAGTVLDPDIVTAFLRVPRRDLDRERRRFPGDTGDAAADTATQPPHSHPVPHASL